MKNQDRRNFLRLGMMALAGTIMPSKYLFAEKGTENTLRIPPSSLIPKFNMCGYAAPKLDRVRIGFIGLGMRGGDAVYRISHIANVDINGLSDLIPERAQKSADYVKGKSHNAKTYSGENGWKSMCDRDDIDLIYIATPWHLHTPMAVYAMKAGKHVALEVPAAKTIEECWELVETSEKTKKHCMMLENCCYGFFELMTLNMARAGFFGEIIHGEGAYIHNLIDWMSNKNGYQDMWRLKENQRNGNLYPTHGLGPICQIMNINRGDQMDYLTSLSSADFSLKAEMERLAKTDDFYAPYAKMNYRGNMNITNIKTKQGKSIMIQHDVSSPRVYSRIDLISGTKAIAMQWPVVKIATTSETARDEWLSEKEMKELENRFQAEIVVKVGEMAKKIGGHGGMDLMMDWRLIDCLRNGLPLDQDVYDAALWSAVGPLSEKSVAQRSSSVDVPDFTRGAWKTNKPVDITLNNGGTTEII